MKKQIKLVSFVLLFALSLSLFVNASAVTPDAAPAEAADAGEPAFALPEIVGAKEAKENGYVARIRSEETNLNTLVFQNEDGSHTMRLYDFPVKYIDEKGETVDISLDLKEAGDGGFRSNRHTVDVKFSKNISDGISLTYGDISIKMIPESEENAEVKRKDEKTVSYALDGKTSYEYNMTYAGFKEDIVVSEYTGRTEYDFTLLTNGLAVKKIGDSYFIADVEGNVKANIGDVIIFTADERNNAFGALSCETVEENREYRLTIHIDGEYLRDENTVYPIRIDPTIEVNYDNNGAGAIEDITLNSLDTSSGGSGSIFAGKRDPYGISRALMKFPGLVYSSSITSDSQIISATVEVRDLMCESTPLDIYVHRFTGSTWSENDSTVGWNTVSPNSYVATPLDYKTVSYSNGQLLDPMYRYSFDITDAAKVWYSSSTDQNKGIMFKASASVETGNTYISRTFGSYNRAVNKPSLTVEYVPIVMLSDYVINVDEGDTFVLTASSSPTASYFSWLSADSSVATVNSSGTVTGVHAGYTYVTVYAYINGAIYYARCDVYVKIPDGVYSIKNYDSNLFLTSSGYITNLSTNFIDVYQDPDYSVITEETTRIRQMWKIKYIANGLYSIRPMFKLDFGLDVTDDEVDLYKIGVTDSLSGVNEDCLWQIQAKDSCYLLENNTSGYIKTQSSGNTIIPGGNINEDACMWILDEYLSSIAGVFLYSTKTHAVTSADIFLDVGENKTLSQLSIIAVSYCNSNIDQTVSWSSSNNSIVNVNTYTGNISCINVGVSTISASKILNGQTKSASYDAKISRQPNPDGQNKDNWCWAAASKMVGAHNDVGPNVASTFDYLDNLDGLHYYNEAFYGISYEMNMTADYVQRSIVVNVKGSDKDWLANLANIESALQLASYNIMNIGTWGGGSLSAGDINNMNNELSNGRWVIGVVFTYIPLYGIIGHAIVIKDFDTLSGDYLIWDPWTDNDWYFNQADIINNAILLEGNNTYWRLGYVQYCN